MIAQTALARHYTYNLFGRLYLQGLANDLLPTVRAIPELAERLPDPINADEAAADHQQLFGFNLFPYQSIFLDATGLLGGLVSEQVSTVYQEAGFQIDSTAGSPDHAGHELAFLSFLAGAEADAWEDGKTIIAQQLRRRQAHFLHDHLLRWLPPLALAIRQQGQPFYRSLTDLTLAFLEAEIELLKITWPPDPPFLLPAPALLESEKTGLKEIAAYLLAPPYSGFFFSRDDIGRLARQRRLPRGFAGREQMLVNLFRSAAQYEALPALLADLQAVVSEAQAGYQRLADALPGLAPYTIVWQIRAGEARSLLLEMKARIGRHGFAAQE